jgi:cytochrome c biogenesis protein CcmG, thiol:disulfide interchange protein DsbE
MKRTAVVSLLVFMLVTALVWFGVNARDAFAPVDIGSRAPDFSATTLDGRAASLADYEGYVILLNLWATWCPPCVEEMPALQRLHDRLVDEGFRVVAVSVDAPVGAFGPFGQPGGDVRAFVDDLGLDFPVLHDPSGEIQRRYRAPGLPSSYIIDREGRIRQRILGARNWDDPRYAESIRELLRG